MKASARATCSSCRCATDSESHGGIGRNRQVQLGEDRLGALAHLGVEQPSAARELAAGEDVARDGEVGEAQHLLVDHADAALERFARAAEVQPLAAPVHLAGIRLQDPGEHFQQGGFAGAVFPHQGVRLPLGDAERDAAQRLDGAERLADVCELKPGG